MSADYLTLPDAPPLPLRTSVQQVYHVRYDYRADGLRLSRIDTLKNISLNCLHFGTNARLLDSDGKDRGFVRHTGAYALEVR